MSQRISAAYRLGTVVEGCLVMGMYRYVKYWDYNVYTI